MSPRFWLYLLILALGLAVLAWPEQDSRMFVTLSERHGPSTLDLLGLAFILAGYLPMVTRVWTRRNHLASHFGAAWPWMLALIALSWIGIVVGLMAEQEPVLWTSVAVSTIVQSVVIVPAFRRM